MRKMADDQNLSRFINQAIAYPRRSIAWLQIARRGEFRERVACSPERFSRLLRTELPAMPNHIGTHTAFGRLAREKIDGRPANRRQWTLGIDFGTDRITVMDQIEMHRMDHSAREPHGIGGWLLVLCGLLLVWGPLSSALIASNALSALALRGRSLAVVLIARTLITSFGVAAGLALLIRRGPAVTMAKAALILSAVTDVVVYTTPYFPNNRMPGDTPFYVAASLAYHGAWLAYLMRSERVRNTYS